MLEAEVASVNSRKILLKGNIYDKYMNKMADTEGLFIKVNWYGVFFERLS